jgi:uncharacterized OB-fold protein
MINDGIFEDRRTLELKYRMPVANIMQFFKGLEDGKIRATKCKKCGEIYFPPQADCSKCMGKDMEWIDLDGESSLETFTIVNIPPTSFSNVGSYVVAIGLLKEGVRVLSWLNDDENHIKIGMKMRLKPVKKEGGYYSYEFFPDDKI